jgi:hypothetical protein
MIIALEVNLRLVWTVLKLFVKRKPLLLPVPFELVDDEGDKSAGPVVH